MDEQTAPAPDWDAVGIDYRQGVKLADIFERHHITRGQFNAHRERAGWAKRNKAAVNRERLVGRILWLVNHQIKAMETQVEEGKQADVAVITQLVGALGRLLRFESGSGKAPKPERETAELKDIRDRLVRRIEELKRH
jgi:hypothetical protein